MIDSNLKVIIKGVTYRYGNLPDELKAQYDANIQLALDKKEAEKAKKEKENPDLVKPYYKRKKG